MVRSACGAKCLCLCERCHFLLESFTRNDSEYQSVLCVCVCVLRVCVRTPLPPCLFAVCVRTHASECGEGNVLGSLPVSVRLKIQAVHSKAITMECVFNIRIIHQITDIILGERERWRDRVCTQDERNVPARERVACEEKMANSSFSCGPCNGERFLAHVTASVAHSTQITRCIE